MEINKDTISQMGANQPTPSNPTQQTPNTPAYNEEEAAKNLDPKLKKDMDSYVASLMYVMHNPKTSQNVLDMLKAGPPEQTIPATALYLNDTVEKTFEKKSGAPVKDAVKVSGAVYLTSDLSELGNAAKLWDTPVTEKDIPILLQKTMTKYIHRGIKEGKIDPIKLQEDVEPLLTDEQRQVGQKYQQGMNIPGEPTASMGIDTYVKNKTKPLEEENMKLKSLLSQQQQAQAQVQQQQQGGSQ